ncbi:MAG: alpha-glucosidase [Spirochaetia bacterium]|jgi:oligo-1,6-glucosidase|nr:alpha-glucosidase [Spirochaetia bacterium]
MEERKWWKEGIVYQIYPRSFMDSDGDGIGDLNGITSKLDYLKYLGIDIIWLCPIYKSPNYDNGYDISDYQAIMDEFGNMNDFNHLLKEAHARKLRIIMDLVVNHTSSEHEWFIESKSSKDNDKRDFYIWRDGKEDADGNRVPPNNWGSEFGGPAWQYDQQTGQYYLHLFTPQQPDLNWENRQVRNAVYKMMTWWGNKGIDGFRMDVITMISKKQSLPDGEPKGKYGDFYPYSVNGPRIHEFLKEMNGKVISKFDWMTVGEGPGASVFDAQRYTGSDRHELNMIFGFDHVNIGKDKPGNDYDLEPLDLVEWKKIWEKWQIGLEGTGWNSLYLQNHDQPRSVSRFGNDDPKYWQASAKMLALVLHMMKGTPYIYQGEEIGMTNRRWKDMNQFRDVAALNGYTYLQQAGYSETEALALVAKMSRDNARTPMQWTDGKQAGFTTGDKTWIGINENWEKINVKQQLSDPSSILQFYRLLINFRHNSRLVCYGKFTLLEKEDRNLFVYTRELEEEKMLVIANFTNQKQPYGLPDEFVDGRIMISNMDRIKLDKELELSPYEAMAIMKAKN